MATFKVNQRVRFIRTARPLGPYDIVGKEAVVVGLGRHLGPSKTGITWDCHVHFEHIEDPINCMFSELAPLTDPSADAWADAQVKKWTKPVPESERVKQAIAESEGK